MKGNTEIIFLIIGLLFLFLGGYEIRRGIKYIKNPKKYNRTNLLNFIMWGDGSVKNGWIILIRGILLVLTLLFVASYLLLKLKN
jgi:hypothetical protein